MVFFFGDTKEDRGSLLKCAMAGEQEMAHIDGAMFS